ncbi:MAG: hypothetical protein A2521_06165 [Deltaproteobacteria bacterium RIFOXYD12_FULL_57_12]|nr:MAG: hypothetical protein A2521_06165 [Deltaproteobacteria bacterium RIFOXYD12_FULL_57_12]
MRPRVAAAGALALAALVWWAARRPPPARDPLVTLEEILLSRNDNDPRLDTDFNGLSEQDRILMRVRYREFAPERRNERGTIVYLLGKDPRSSEDWDFLREVVREPPCLSLADCSKRSKGTAEMGDEVTLAYPALVALKQAERALAHGPSTGARAVIADAKASKTRAVARMAAEVGRRAAPAR